MASLVLRMSVSRDGYVAPIDGSTDWIAAGGSDDALSWTPESIGDGGGTWLHGWGETTIAAGDLAEAITRLKLERSVDEPCRGDRLAESAAGPAIGHLGHDSKQQPAVFGRVGVHPGDADGQDDHEHACRRAHLSSLRFSR